MPASRYFTLIELGSIGMVTSSASPRMPSGPALMRTIELALKCVRSMFWLVVIVKESTPLAKLVITWPAVGEMTVTLGAVSSTMNGAWALGSAGLDWLPLWSMMRTRAT